MLQSFQYCIKFTRKFSIGINNRKHPLMATIKTVLIDISGTLSIDNKEVPGSVAALERLQKAPVDIKFVTNTTTMSKKTLYEELTQTGFDVDINEVYTALMATNDFLKRENLKPLFLLPEDSVKNDFPDFSSFDGKPNSVVVGLAPQQFSRANLNKALRILLDGGKLIATHQSRYIRAADGKLSLGPGPFVQALEYASGVRAVTIGKPNSQFFMGALDKIPPENAVMIGDDVKNDIYGAQDLGMRGYLVKTGKYLEGDENKINPRPYKVVNSFSAAVDDIVASLNK
ncbi:hypothetical protein O3M35_002204 [Rhynocoris fuscipes]|uniref:Haloacid dehalogenase-like hydrolase domain-containing protein 2 n=1 Tax=Rhynocoris fuscipes TaxID=488301 RepID=A0AAW1CYC1_9HEMI